MANKRRNQAPRIFFGCLTCKIPLCNHKKCWDGHINVVYEDGGCIDDSGGVPRYFTPPGAGGWDTRIHLFVQSTP